MRLLIKFILSAAISMTMACAAFALDPTSIRSTMHSGDYQAAFAEAESLQSAAGYALAAECLLTEIMLGKAKKNKKQAKAARKLAEAALELDPTHQNARLQYAIADGFITRETGDVSAWMKKLPQKTYAIVQAYRTDFPDDVRGDALLGAWHLAVVRKAGEKNAQKWFEASIADGQALFETAMIATPDDAVIGVNYAFSLIALDEDDLPDVTMAYALLNRLIAAKPTDHLSQTVLGYGREALTIMEDRGAAQDYTGQFLDGKKPSLTAE